MNRLQNHHIYGEARGYDKVFAMNVLTMVSEGLSTDGQVKQGDANVLRHMLDLVQRNNIDPGPAINPQRNGDGAISFRAGGFEFYNQLGSGDFHVKHNGQMVLNGTTNKFGRQGSDTGRAIFQEAIDYRQNANRLKLLDRQWQDFRQSGMAYPQPLPGEFLPPDLGYAAGPPPSPGSVAQFDPLGSGGVQTPYAQAAKDVLRPQPEARPEVPQTFEVVINGVAYVPRGTT